MSKRQVARLLKIKPEGLTHHVRPARENDDTLRVIIAEEVRRQFEDVIREILLPEIKKLMAEMRQPVQPLPDQPESPTAAAPIRELIQAQPEITLTPALDEFPILDDVEVLADVGLEKFADESAPALDEMLWFSPVTPDGVAPDEEILPLAEEPTFEPGAEPAPVPLVPIGDRIIRIGIDFGTTTTAVSVSIDGEIPEALPIGIDGVTRYMPSVVYFKQGPGDLLQRAVFGEEAEAYADDSRIIRSVKRCLGCGGGNCQLAKSSGNGPIRFPFPWCRGDGLIFISEDEPVEPIKIAELIIHDALDRAIKVIRERKLIDLTMENVQFLPLNLGCGANFDLRQRELIVSAAQSLGFQQVSFDNVVEEPILAGFAFLRYAEEIEGRCLIYDFGGGTFDVAILDIDRMPEGRRVTVVSTAGENWLGGDDIDHLVYGLFLTQISTQIGITPDAVEEMLGEDRSKLRSLAKKAKEQLSSLDEFADVLPSEMGYVRLTLDRGKFETTLNASGLIEKSLEAVLRACKLAYAFEKAKEGELLDGSAIVKHKLLDANAYIERVVLVGGITKIPFIRKKLVEIFGEAKIVKEEVIEPISAVAIGAGYPRYPQHYSICTPPFGVYLEYEDTQIGGRVKKTIFEPYEYLDFYKNWASSSDYLYPKRVPVSFNSTNLYLYRQKAGEDCVDLKIPIPLKLAGEVIFEFSMDGQIIYKHSGNPITLMDYPIIHPVQQAIRQAKEKRIAAEYLKQQQQIRSYEEDIRRMMTEN